MELERIQARVERLYLGFSNQAPTTKDHPPTQEHGIARTCRIDSVLLLSTARRRALSCRDRPWPIQSDSETHSLCQCVLRLVFCRRTLLSKHDIIMLFVDTMYCTGVEKMAYIMILFTERCIPRAIGEIRIRRTGGEHTHIYCLF
jgi:hypothetical protein